MNDVKQLLEDGETNATLFIRRLSFWLVNGAVVLMVFAVTLQLADVRAPGGLALRNTDPETVARMQWGAVFLVATVWMFFIYTFRSIGKRKEWARKATIGIFSILTFSFVWNGVLMLLMSAAILQIKFATTQSLSWSGRILFTLVGSMFLVLAWLCWRLIRNLRTQVVRNVFQK